MGPLLCGRYKFLASGGEDETAVVWDVFDEKKIAEFPHDYWIKSVDFSPDGRFLASNGGFKAVVVWDLSCRKKLTEFHHEDWVNSVEFSPDGRYLASGSKDNTAVVWDLHDGRKVAEFQQLALCGSTQKYLAHVPFPSRIHGNWRYRRQHRNNSRRERTISHSRIFIT